MTHPITPFSELTVVGYSPVPEADALPAIATAVFRKGDDLLFAPYRLTPAGLLGGAIDKPEVLDARAEKGTARKLDSALAAEKGYVLWIDEDGMPHYSPKEKVLKRIDEVSQSCLAGAEVAFESDDLDNALSLAKRAIRVDEDNVYAYVLAAAVYKRRNEHTRADRVAQAAQAVVKGFPFEKHVAKRLAAARGAVREDTPRTSCGNLENIAIQHPIERRPVSHVPA